jgi:hypothetical protein
VRSARKFFVTARQALVAKLRACMAGLVWDVEQIKEGTSCVYQPNRQDVPERTLGSDVRSQRFLNRPSRLERSQQRTDEHRRAAEYVITDCVSEGVEHGTTAGRRCRARQPAFPDLQY